MQILQRKKKTRLFHFATNCRNELQNNALVQLKKKKSIRRVDDSLMHHCDLPRCTY